MSRAKARVMVEYNGKRYRLHGRGKCGTKSCALFKEGVCDNFNKGLYCVPCRSLFSAMENVPAKENKKIAEGEDNGRNGQSHS